MVDPPDRLRPSCQICYPSWVIFATPRKPRKHQASMTCEYANQQQGIVQNKIKQPTSTGTIKTDPLLTSRLESICLFSQHEFCTRNKHPLSAKYTNPMDPSVESGQRPNQTPIPNEASHPFARLPFPPRLSGAKSCTRSQVLGFVSRLYSGRIGFT